VVERGDTLWGLAARPDVYNNGARWTEFGFKRDPRTLQVGEVIKVGSSNGGSSNNNSSSSKNKSTNSVSGDTGHRTEDEGSTIQKYTSSFIMVPNRNRTKDILTGIFDSFYFNSIGGPLNFIANLFGYSHNAKYICEYDYYTGRVVGDVLSMYYGTIITIKGVSQIVGSIAAGAGVTVGSGGTLVVAGVAISVAGVAGALAGAGVVTIAAKNFGGNLSKLNSSKTPVSKQNSPIWNNLQNYKNGIKQSGSGSNKKYYEWDHTHSDIEVYNKNGVHLGSMNSATGEMYKPAVSGRNIRSKIN